ncbi:MAG: hypothetical protein VX699_07490 [Myxococcota bacterium]|nr:hypothetical protein [Myxococcota bacterium]
MTALLSVLQHTPLYGLLALLLLAGLIFCVVKNLMVIAGTLGVLLIGMTLFLQTTEPAVAAKERARQKRISRKLDQRLQEKAAEQPIGKDGKKVRKSVGTTILPRASRLKSFTKEEIRAAKAAARAQGLSAQEAIQALIDEEEALAEEAAEEEAAEEEAAFQAPTGLSPEDQATQIKAAKEELDQKMKEHVDKVKGAADDTRKLLNELKGR